MDNNELYNSTPAEGQAPADAGQQGYQGYTAPAQDYTAQGQNYAGYTAPDYGYNAAQQGQAPYYGNIPGAPAGGYQQPAAPLKPQEPGEHQAAIALVLGILGTAMGSTGIIGLVLSVVGLFMASSSKKAGYNGGLRTAAFILCVVGCVFSALWALACVTYCGAIGSLISELSDLGRYSYYY